LALEQSPGRSILVMNSDIVVKPDVVTKITSLNGDLILAVERRRNLDGEDMRVRLTQQDAVVAIGKDLKPNLSHGEFIGVSLIRPPAARLYQEIATDLEWQADTDHYYEDLYGMMIGPVVVRASIVEAGEYAEVDSPEDQQAAAEVISRHYPREAAGVG
jgi:choline kinase